MNLKDRNILDFFGLLQPKNADGWVLLVGQILRVFGCISTFLNILQKEARGGFIARTSEILSLNCSDWRDPEEGDWQLRIKTSAACGCSCSHTYRLLFHLLGCCSFRRRRQECSVKLTSSERKQTKHSGAIWHAHTLWWRSILLGVHVLRCLRRCFAAMKDGSLNSTRSVQRGSKTWRANIFFFLIIKWEVSTNSNSVVIYTHWMVVTSHKTGCEPSGDNNITNTAEQYKKKWPYKE